MNRLYHPRSFFSLLLTGFVVVALPLIVAMLSAIHVLDSLSQRSTVAVFRCVNRIDYSKKIAELIDDEERSARIFSVLQEQSHLENVNKIHDELSSLFKQIISLDPERKLLAIVGQLQEKERRLVDSLNAFTLNPQTDTRDLLSELSAYKEIASLATAVERLCNALMIEEVDTLRDHVQTNKSTMMWQVSVLLGFSVLLVMLFLSLINRPVSQMDKSIDRLGEGDFATPIIVSGPKDLEAIGRKLDWLRKRLMVLDREKLKMLAHISHELKTPLSSIKEGTGLLRDGVIGPLTSNQTEVVAILDSNCLKLQQLIQNILDFNMAKARNAPPQVEPIRMDALILEVAEDHRTVMMARHINLKAQLEPALVAVPAGQLKTVIDNLLGNAVKFTPDAGEIRITLVCKEGKASLSIEDTGPGIDEEDRPQIFLPFFQGKQKHFSSIKGSGLGLAVSKEYLHNCGGSLRLLPGRPEQGAHFLATIPLVHPEHS